MGVRREREGVREEVREGRGKGKIEKIKREQQTHWHARKCTRTHLSVHASMHINTVARAHTAHTYTHGTCPGLGGPLSQHLSGIMIGDAHGSTQYSLRQASLSRATKQLMPMQRGRRPPPPTQGGPGGGSGLSYHVY